MTISNLIVLLAAAVAFASTAAIAQGQEAQLSVNHSKVQNPVERAVKGRTHRFNGRSYQRSAVKQGVDYYIFYHSASWCGPCRMLIGGSVKKYQSKVSSNPKVELIHVSSDRSEGAAAKWAKQHGFSWPTLLPSEAKQVRYAQGAKGVPRAVLYDAAGNKLADVHAARLSSLFAKIK